jgi:ribonucrease Y
MPGFMVLVFAVAGFVILALVVTVVTMRSDRPVRHRLTRGVPDDEPTLLDPVLANRQGLHSEAAVLSRGADNQDPHHRRVVDGSTDERRSPQPVPEPAGQPIADSGLHARGSADPGMADQDSSTPAGMQAAGPLGGPAVASVQEARREVRQAAHRLREDLQEQRSDLERREQRLAHREERLDRESRRLQERGEQLTELEQTLAAQRAALLDIADERRQTLERLAGLTAEEAKAQLVADVESDAKRRATFIVRDIERAATDEGEQRAREIITTAIQRLASEQTSESVVSTVQLPSDDMKGRIIGREGRNIRAFEQTTGVNLVVDDTPEAVVLSCFDPVRREVGRLTLQELVADGRIHPSRIEDVYRRCRADVDKICQRAGEDALVEADVTNLHPQLTFKLGQLQYRTSYGQNVLKHLVESAHVAGMIADELGVQRTLCKRAALLHDIGKAMTHEAEGSHAMVGAELARRYGECDDVVHAIEAHHNEVEPRTVEAILTQAADAISGGRPGARRESMEAYVQRLERLEEIAMSCGGVEKVFAMQAGREIRVMVEPDVVDDIEAQVLARDLAKQIEHELTYPGQIKVTVIRESRATEIAR